MTGGSSYQIQSGDTLDKVAAAHGTDVATLLKANPSITDANKIAAGSALNIPGTDAAAPGTTAPGPTTTNIPGIGTLTKTPKVAVNALPTGPAPSSTDASANASDEAGLYARTGVQPPTTTPPTDVSRLAGESDAAYNARMGAINAKGNTGNGPTGPVVPTYPTGPTPGSSADKAAATIADTYKTMSGQLDAIAAKIAADSAPSAHTQDLAAKVAAAQAALAKFDEGSLAASENLLGQGRGLTTGNISIQDTQIQRTRALERLGMANDEGALAALLTNAQSSDKNLSDADKEAYTLASSKFDRAMNVADKMQSLSQTEQNNARQYLLDVVSFADGKNYDQLDAATQQAITSTVANSPITLDMVKTALASGATKAKNTADAAATGNLHNVAGVGLVKVSPDGKGGFTTQVVVPEVPKTGGNFTSTQLNNGAANSGLAISDFGKLDADTQNYFVNTYTSSSPMAKAIAAATTPGAKSSTYTQIKSSNLSDPIKSVLYQQLGVDATGKPLDGSSSGGFLSGVGSALGGAWNGISSFLGL